jgi:hypothetical protein
MNTNPFSSFRPYLPATLTMALMGWVGLAFLLNLSLPTVWPRWLFFFLWFLALTGTALPITWFLNLRFPSTPPVGVNIIVRQAIWVGLYGGILAWLQLGRVATIWSFIGLAAGLVAIEYLIRWRERARWKPAPIDDEASLSPIEPPSESPDAQPPVTPVG